MTLARSLTAFWGTLVAGVLALWLVRPDLLSEPAVERALLACGPWAFAAFVGVTLVRGLLFVPSTPVVLAGGALFPHAPVAVVGVSLVGIVTTAVLLHRFPSVGGFDTRLVTRHPERMERLRRHLEAPYALWAVAAWAFFPAVPTDLVCYTAGLVRMPLRRLLVGLLIGEVPLVVAYVLIGKEVMEWLG